MAGQAIHCWLRLLVRLVTVPAGILHRGIRRPANPFTRESLVTGKAALTTGEKLFLLYQELMAGGAVECCHPAYLNVCLLVADATDGPRRVKAMDGNRMALGAGYVLSLGMLNVTGGGGYLNPLGAAALVTFFTKLILDYGVLFDSLIVTEGEIKNQLGSGEQALLVATVAADILVLAGCPAVPRFLHNVAGLAKVRVILHIVIETDKLVDSKRDGNKNDDGNRYYYLFRLAAPPVPETLYPRSEPAHHYF